MRANVYKTFNNVIEAMSWLNAIAGRDDLDPALLEEYACMGVTVMGVRYVAYLTVAFGD
jgi:hypothetical protein